MSRISAAHATRFARSHWSLSLFALALGALPSAAAGQDFRPNIILIYADDLGYGHLGCYGQTKIPTPNIDRLAREGLRFTQHYSGAAICAPARAVLLTGRHTGHAPIRANRELRPEGQFPLPAEIPTCARVLRDAGYATGAFGKWGLGFVHTSGDPRRQGFDHFFGYNCQRQAHRAYPPYLWENDRQRFLPGNDLHRTTTYAPDVIHARALDFIRTHRAGPFFLFLPTTLPHAELLPPDDETLAPFARAFPETPFPGSRLPPWPGAAAYGPDAGLAHYSPQAQPHAALAAMIARLDRHVGEILRLLAELHIDEHTLVLFTSDNGPADEGGADPDFFVASGGLRGGKRALYEGGLRVPLIARWPGHVSPGRTTDHLCAGWDFFATFAEVAQAPLPSATDGISFLPTLRATPGAQRLHDRLYWEFPGDGGVQAVRAGNWKGIRFFATKSRPERFELYDLDTDPHETQDLAATHPDRVAAIAETMRHEHGRNSDFPLSDEARRATTSSAPTISAPPP